MAKKESVYQALRPLLLLLSLYGLNRKRFLIPFNVISFCVFAYKYVRFCSLSFAYVCVLGKKNYFSQQLTLFDYVASKLMQINWTYLLLVTFGSLLCFSICHLFAPRLNSLFELLKGCEMSEKCSRKFRKFKLLFLVIYCFVLYTTFGSVKRWDYHVLWKFYNGTLLLCLPLCSFFFCLLPIYVSYTLEEAFEEVKGCRSPLRRARLTTRLVLLATRLDRLTRASDRCGDMVVFILKGIASPVFVIIGEIVLLICGPGAYGEMFLEMVIYSAPDLLLLFIYAWFLHAAARANSMVREYNLFLPEKYWVTGIIRERAQIT